MDHETDVIVIGGGAAGLAAAMVLSAEGLRVSVLEARQRLGGRIDTLHDPAWPLPIERGAEFIHGRPRETFEIAEAGGATLYEVTDEHWVQARGGLKKQEDFFEEVEKVLSVVEKVGKQDMTFDEAVAKFGKGLPAEAKRAARMYVAGFDAADPATVSARWLAETRAAAEKIDGDKLFRVYAGYDRIVYFLKTGIADAGASIEMGALVDRVAWGETGVEVFVTRKDGAKETHRGRAVVVTLPLGVLQAKVGEQGAVMFEPELPAGKREAIESLGMGNVVKVLLRFREPFWEEVDAELDFWHAPESAFPTWWTTLPMRTSVLTGWAGGPAAAALSGKSEDALLTEAVGSLSAVLKVGRRRIEGLLEGAHVADWASRPLSRGAYSFARAGGAGAAKKLAASVGGVLFFAGEATEVGMAGTVAGAIASGERAGREAARRLRR